METVIMLVIAVADVHKYFHRLLGGNRMRKQETGGILLLIKQLVSTDAS